MKITRVPGEGQKRLTFLLKNLQDGKVGKVGWLDGSAYLSGITVARVASIQEFGYSPKNIPPRPFMRIAIRTNEKKWSRIAENGAKAMLIGSFNLAQVMEGIGLSAAGDVRKSISQLINPPLKASTISARLRRRANKTTVGKLTKPLVDTGFMLATLTNSVEDE